MCKGTLIIKRKEKIIMARPIRETPILHGEDARRFEERMKNPPKETKEQRERREKNYEYIKSIFVGKL